MLATLCVDVIEMISHMFSHIMSTFKLYNKKKRKYHEKKYFICVLFTSTFEITK